MSVATLNVAGPLSWLAIVRLGLVQAALGAVVVLVTSTLNRVMVVEFALPAALPAILVALHYSVQLVRPHFGHGSDVGGRRTVWILGGILVLAAGGISCAASALLMPTHLIAGVMLAVVAYAVVGLGVGAAGTSLLALMANRVSAQRRGAAATIMWVMMIFGFALTSSTASHYLDPFSPQRLLRVMSVTGLFALLVTALALWGIEGRATAVSRGPLLSPRHGHASFAQALREVWQDADARRFTWFVFVSMLAYSAQELLLEPFAGLVFGYSIGASAKLSGTWHAGVLVGMVTVGCLYTLSRRLLSLRTAVITGCVGSGLALVGLASAGLVGPRWPLVPPVALLGLANGVFAVAAIGYMMELSHRGSAGSSGIRMGLWGAAQALAFACGGLFSNFALDVLRHVLGTTAPAFAAVFMAEGLLFCGAAVLAGRLQSRATEVGLRSKNLVGI